MECDLVTWHDAQPRGGQLQCQRHAFDTPADVEHWLYVLRKREAGMSLPGALHEQLHRRVLVDGCGRMAAVGEAQSLDRQHPLFLQVQPFA